MAVAPIEVIHETHCPGGQPHRLDAFGVRPVDQSETHGVPAEVGKRALPTLHARSTTGKPSLKLLLIQIAARHTA